MKVLFVPTERGKSSPRALASLGGVPEYVTVYGDNIEGTVAEGCHVGRYRSNHCKALHNTAEVKHII